MILGDKLLISEVVLSQLLSRQRPKLVTHEEDGDGNEIYLETEAKTKQQNGALGN
jgi:hypothetical protein